MIEATVGGVETSPPSVILWLRWGDAASAAAVLPVTEAAVGGDEDSLPLVLSFSLGWSSLCGFWNRSSSAWDRRGGAYSSLFGDAAHSTDVVILKW